MRTELARPPPPPGALAQEPGLLCLRRDGQPHEIVVEQPGVGVQPCRVGVEVDEGPCAWVKDAGPLLDEPADGTQGLEEVVDVLQISGSRVAHERHGMPAPERPHDPGIVASKPTRGRKTRGVAKGAQSPPCSGTSSGAA